MNAIVAVSPSWGIGLRGELLFHLKGDMKFFRETTLGGTVIMGRKTLDSFPEGRPLKGRRNIVITREEGFAREGAEIVHSPEEALGLVADTPAEQVFVIGGGQIYEALLPFCDKALVTHVDEDRPADTFFPNLSRLPGWEVTELSEPRSEGDAVYRFAVWENLLLKDILT